MKTLDEIKQACINDGYEEYLENRRKTLGW